MKSHIADLYSQQLPVLFKDSALAFEERLNLLSKRGDQDSAEPADDHPDTRADRPTECATSERSYVCAK